MALTKLTKHIVYGATIVQVRYKDMSNLDTTSTTAVEWDNITMTPEYSDSIMEVRMSGTMSHQADSSAPNQGTYDSPRVNMLLEINGTTEYTVNDAASVATFDRSYSSAAGRREGKSVNMYHRHLPGTTNLQTATVKCNRTNNNAGGNLECRGGFLMTKEVAGGITLGTPGNAYVN